MQFPHFCIRYSGIGHGCGTAFCTARDQEKKKKNIVVEQSAIILKDVENLEGKFDTCSHYIYSEG
jgi:hypothetical protein